MAEGFAFFATSSAAHFMKIDTAVAAAIQKSKPGWKPTTA